MRLPIVTPFLSTANMGNRREKSFVTWINTLLAAVGKLIARYLDIVRAAYGVVRSLKPNRTATDEETVGPDGRESEVERLNRRFSEVLQEIRVAQTGVQILFAFLLTMVFSPGFADTTEFQRGVYLVTLMFTVAATGLLIGPVAYHRLTSGRQMRTQLVNTANHLALGGIGALLLSLAGSILLITDVVLGGWWAIAITAVTVVWLSLLWYALPIARRGSLTSGRRNRRRGV